jgi:hypothetical protein
MLASLYDGHAYIWNHETQVRYLRAIFDSNTKSMNEPLFAVDQRRRISLDIDPGHFTPCYVSIRLLSRLLRCRTNLVRVHYPATLLALFSQIR